VALLAFKDERRLELYARGAERGWTPIRAYTVLAASGEIGPKLREGDKQVPEGLYRVTSLNANSKFHVSLRLDYPNAFDLRMAQLEGRSNVGRDIMIHGKDVSAGCLAIGDEAAEELFTLAAMVMPGAVHTVIAPTDFRANTAKAVRIGGARWTSDLYSAIRAELANYPLRGLIASPGAR
jgi:murein L,D-transpeptidase YafK